MPKQKGRVELRLDIGSLSYQLPARAKFGGYAAFAKLLVIETGALTQQVVDLAVERTDVAKAVMTKNFIELYTKSSVESHEAAKTLSMNFVDEVQLILTEPERNRARARATKAAARSSRYVNRH